MVHTLEGIRTHTFRLCLYGPVSTSLTPPVIRPFLVDSTFLVVKGLGSPTVGNFTSRVKTFRTSLLQVHH